MKFRMSSICLKIAGACMIMSAFLAWIAPRGIQVYTCIGCTILFGFVCFKAKISGEQTKEAVALGSIEKLISELRGIDENIGLICTNGACYKLAKFLKRLYPECVLYISPNKAHVVVRYHGKFYDIDGERSCFGYTPLPPEDEAACTAWSFSKIYHAGHICQECGELIEQEAGKATEKGEAYCPRT